MPRQGRWNRELRGRGRPLPQILVEIESKPSSSKDLRLQLPPGFSNLPTAMFKTRKLQFQVFAHLEIWVRKQGQIKWGPKVAGAALLPVGQAGSNEVLIFILLNSNGAKQHFFELPSQVYHGFSC